jgi:hypothetical protein
MVVEYMLRCSMQRVTVFTFGIGDRSRQAEQHTNLKGLREMEQKMFSEVCSCIVWSGEFEADK